ncbi:hypothetical protein BH24GEM1_BH24GEM1_20820 [soil metagenome]
MGGSYRQCTECGKRALSIATRCPGCGRELPSPAVPTGSPFQELRRFMSPGMVAGVLAVAAAFGAAELGRTSPALAGPSFPDSADSMAAFSEVAYVAAGTARLGTATAAASPAENAGELLVARTWTHVRGSRSRRAGLEAMLTPGDTVLADSLERDWYRVALEGEVLGYVHRSTLTDPGTRTEQPAREDRPGT